MGEIIAGQPDRSTAHKVRLTVMEMGFSFLPFEDDCVAPFSQLRSVHRLKAPDSINLACAATGRVDMFLTGDVQLLKRGLHIPGIHFIADFTLPVL